MTTSDPYRRLAPVYDRLIEPMQSGVRAVALKVAAPQGGWRVLDVGCGTGTDLARYLDAGCDVAGVDTSPTMLAKATSRLGDRADLHLTDGSRLPFKELSFDLVTTSLVLHEVPADSRVAFLLEMTRVAKPDGTVLVTDYRFGSLRGWKGPTLRTLTNIVERFSGHYSGYRSFKTSDGVPGVARTAGLTIDREKIVAGGNLAVYVVSAADSAERERPA